MDSVGVGAQGGKSRLCKVGTLGIVIWGVRGGEGEIVRGVKKPWKWNRERGEREGGALRTGGGEEKSCGYVWCDGKRRNHERACPRGECESEQGKLRWGKLSWGKYSQPLFISHLSFSTNHHLHYIPHQISTPTPRSPPPSLRRAYAYVAAEPNPNFRCSPVYLFIVYRHSITSKGFWLRGSRDFERRRRRWRGRGPRPRGAFGRCEMWKMILLPSEKGS